MWAVLAAKQTPKCQTDRVARYQPGGGYQIQESICALRRNSVKAVVLTANVARIYAQVTRLDPCIKSLRGQGMEQ